MQRIPLGDRTYLLVLTGAGVSAESGIPTFRDAGGLWEGHSIEDVASPEGFERDPYAVWRFYSQRRQGVASVSPNPAHHAIARAEEQLGDRFLLVTQNVDGLHTAAGSQRVIEIHGNLRRTRCHGCTLDSFADTSLHLEGAIPRCNDCGGMLRPDIVWFGEMIPPAALFGIQRFLQSAVGGDLVFLAAGTSGLVYPAAGLVNEAKRKGGTTYLANMDRPENAAAFDHVALGPASKVLPELLGVC